MTYKVSIDTELAKEHGLIGAILYEEIRRGCEHNEKYGLGYKNEGCVWFKSGINDFHARLPFVSTFQIGTTLNELEKSGYIVSGCFNENQYDRTKWYRTTNRLQQ